MSELKVISNQEGSAEIVKMAVSAEIKRLEIALNKTEKEIQKFEKKYKIPSKKFLKDYSAEDLDGGDQEYIRWVGELQIKERVIENLRRLKSIKYVSN